MDSSNRRIYTEGDTSRKFVIAAVVILFVMIVIILVIAFLYKPGAASAASVRACPTMTPPTGVTAISVNITNIHVTWTAVPNAVKYTVYVGTVSQFGRANALESFVTINTSYTVTGLILGRTYYIIVSATNICGNEGSPSSEQSVTLGYPAKFNIVNQSQPSLAMTIDPSLTEIILNPVCSGVGNDNLCDWNYDPGTNEIRADNSTTNCMITNPNINNTVLAGSCNNFGDDVNYINDRTWIYDNSNGSICHPQLNNLTLCIKANGSLAAGTGLVMIPYDGTNLMQWSIVQSQ